MEDIDYEKWAKEALKRAIDEDLRDHFQDATKISAKLVIRAIKGEDVTLATVAVQAAVRNLVVAGIIGSASEGEDLLKKILNSLGDVLVSMGKKALGLA